MIIRENCTHDDLFVGYIDLVLDYSDNGGPTLHVQNTPCYLCEKCSEVLFDEEVLERLTAIREAYFRMQGEFYIDF